MHEEVSSSLRYASISAQKCRLVANQIRGLFVEKAMELLNYSPKKAARLIKKVLNSAIANAEHNNGMDIDNLVISSIYVDESATVKRFRARAKGRGSTILRRKCHVNISVTERS